jgi:hypothetical protein
MSNHRINHHVLNIDAWPVFLTRRSRGNAYGVVGGHRGGGTATNCTLAILSA